jgi:cytochrome c553
MKYFTPVILLLLVSTVGCLITSSALAASDDDGHKFFETKIRPLFSKHCYRCHGAKKQESDLRLDSYEAMMEGGAAGISIVPDEPDESLLLTALKYVDDDLQMPPDKRLSDKQIADVRKWIEMGAPHLDADGEIPEPTPSVDIAAGKQHWAFQPRRPAAIPSVDNQAWTQTPIDHFILAKLADNSLQPSPAASKRTLIRRATFDLIGLPPTPAEVAAFLADESPQAFSRVVDRLLGSVQYGERWGRHWLDVARYADSNGLDENVAHGNAWRYRDYVIAALNSDKPFDAFVIEQLAGDQLPAADVAARHERLIATGFLSLGPKVLAEVDERKMEMDIVDEQIDTVGRVFLALTLGCARCHDHKFDPIPTKDYYALAGIFKSTKTMESFTKIARWHENSIATAAQLKAKEKHDQKIAVQKATIDDYVKRANATLLEKSGSDAKLPKDPESQYEAATKTELKLLRDRLTELEAAATVLPTAMGVVDADVADVAIHVRGSHLTLGKTAPRGVPTVLVSRQPPTIENKRSGRLELARWMTAAEHPLTSRVMVNRIWRWHFGQGLVRSTENFGKLGSRPSHPALLDWLAERFVDTGWSIKRLHRLIMLSSTYQMSSQHNGVAAAIDPENRLLWRAHVRRLEAEAIRDSLLAVAGLIDFSMGGSMLHVDNREFLFDHTSKDETSYDTRRRSVYLPVIRNHLFDGFQLFDYSDASVPNGNRTTSTIAPQALFLMNSELVADAAQALAARMKKMSNQDDRSRIGALYIMTLAREPTPDEQSKAVTFLNRFETVVAMADKLSRAETVQCPDAGSADAGSVDPGIVTAREQAWTALCHVMFVSNEFIHVR